jgi:uncharacterized protein YceK
MRRWPAVLAGLALLPSCGTISSYASGCRGVYSGVREDVELLGTYGAELAGEREIPLGIDGWLANAWDGLFVALDLPLSALVDTAGAPIARAAGQGRPDPAGLGCGWAALPAGPDPSGPRAPDSSER